MPLRYSNTALPEPDDDGGVASAQSESQQFAAILANERRARFHAMVKEIVKDFSRTFATGQVPGDAPAKAPATIGGGTAKSTVVCDNKGLKFFKIAKPKRRRAKK